MTSNTCDIGTVYVSPTDGSDYKDIAYKMFDNDMTTFNGTAIYASYPHYYGFNFNEYTKIYGISIPITDRHTNYFPKNCEIEISDDGVSWNSIKSFTINNSENYNNKIFLGCQLTKYFRLKANNGYYTNYNWSGIAELKIYGK